MRRATFAGTAAFVMFPLSGTGAIGAAVIGQILGMSRAATLRAIAVGSVIGASAMAALTGWLVEMFGPEVANSTGVKVGGLVAVLLALAIITRQYRRMASRMEAENAAKAQEASEA